MWNYKFHISKTQIIKDINILNKQDIELQTFCFKHIDYFSETYSNFNYNYANNRLLGI